MPAPKKKTVKPTAVLAAKAQHIADEAIFELERNSAEHNIQYRILGGTPLKGTVEVGGSKNAAM
jgi:hypothetical protein